MERVRTLAGVWNERLTTEDYGIVGKVFRVELHG